MANRRIRSTNSYMPNLSASAPAWMGPSYQDRRGHRNSDREPLRKTRSDFSPEKSPKDPSKQLPSPLPSLRQKRRAETLAADNRAPKRLKKDTQHSRIDSWLSQLPTETDLQIMDEPPQKRSRWSDSFGLARSWTVSNHGSSAPYAASGYASRLQLMGIFLRDSPSGISEEDQRMCDHLLKDSVATPRHTMFDDETFIPFCERLECRSKLRVSLAIHNLLIAPAEDLFLRGQKACEWLVQGHNDSWNESHPICGPSPQPDQTVGFDLLAFNNTEQSKLRVDAYPFGVGGGIYFPFLTIEVKSGNVSLEVADKQNAHSMTIALRGLIELFQRSGRQAELHRRILTFSISHNDCLVCLYGHYVEIKEGNVTYFRHRIREYIFKDKNGEDRWLCYRFSYNILTKFSAKLLALIRSGIESVPEATLQSLSQVDESASRLQEGDQGRGSSQGGGKGGSWSTGGSTQQRAMFQRLERDSKLREEKLLEQIEELREQIQMERQREESKAREERLPARSNG
ncbi:MAG: hypothetical protein M1817_003902 [Caeruleum heppii]|nr:MAG: hypothetical protein M1817_003902 [Caeruleum heppii]